VERVLLLGSSPQQLLALPAWAQDGFEWAAGELETDPSALPRDPQRGVETKPLRAEIALFHIAVRAGPSDPGYRGIYHSNGQKVLFTRFARRDPLTYRGLRKMVRELREATSR
jgi:hypothetical protein